MFCFFSPLDFWQWVVRVHAFTQHEYIRQLGFGWVRPDRVTSSFHRGSRCQLPFSRPLTYDVIASILAVFVEYPTRGIHCSHRWLIHVPMELAQEQ